MRDSSGIEAGVALRYAQLAGIGGRDTNEDAFACAFSEGASCFVVSDGVGGHEGGEIASKLVVEAVMESFAANRLLVENAVRAHIDHAIVKTAEYKTRYAGLADMSATVVLLVVDCEQRRASWAHLGDTRLYLFRGARLMSVTKDHSVVQQLVDAGYCAYEQLRMHPLRSTLLAAVGSGGEDFFEPAFGQTDILEGDAFLLCTDGLWEWVTEAEMEQTLASASDVEHWLGDMERIAARTSEASSKPRDNYTAFAIMMGDAPGAIAKSGIT